MGITVGASAHFNGSTGAANSDAVVGTYKYYYGGNYLYTHHNGRYTITTDSQGASKITVALGSGQKIASLSNRLRLDVTTSADSHKKNGSGGVALSSNGSGSIDVKLLPNTTYYVWIFCNGNTDYFHDTSLSITSSGTYGITGTPTAPDGVFGSAIPVSITGGTTGARFAVTITCGGRSEYFWNNPATSSGTYDFTWTPAVATYAPLITDAASATATITCATSYNGESAGDPTSTTITVSFPDSIKPTLTSGWATHAPDNSDTAASDFSVYIQGYSKSTVTFDATKITYQYGATFAGYSITCEGVTVSSSPYTTGTLPGTTASIVCTVTDSRGFSASETLTLALNAYARPTMSDISVGRYSYDQDEDEYVPDEDGIYIGAVATVHISAFTGNRPNTPTLAIYTKTPTGTYTQQASDLQSETPKYISTFSPDQAWDVKLELTDSLGNSTYYETRLPSRAWAMKFRPDGNGVGFGKAPQADGRLELGNGWVLAMNDANGNTITLSYAQLQALLAMI